MKKTLSSLLFVALASVAPAAFVTNFNSAVATNAGPGFPNTNFATTVPAAQDGWTMDDTQVQLSFILSSIPTYDKAIGLGGFFASPSVPAITSLNLTRNVPTQTAVGTAFSVDFAIVNRHAADPLNFVAGNDRFGFTLYDGNFPLLTIGFITTAGNNRELAHNGTPVGPNGIVASDYDMLNFYNLSLSFTPGVAGALNYAGSTAGGAVAFNGVIPGQGAANVTKIGVDFDIPGLDGSAAGSNFILFDNISLVPEPSSAIMGLLSLGLLASRRRR